MRRHAPGPLQPALDLDSTPVTDTTPTAVSEPQATAQPAPRSTYRFSETVLAKARIYLQQRRVSRGAHEGWWLVQGSASRPYRVQTDADPVSRTASWITCSCPHGTEAGGGTARCSHAVAVLLAVKDGLVLPVRAAG